MTTQEKLIKGKMNLLELAEYLKCMPSAYTLDTPHAVSKSETVSVSRLMDTSG